MVWRRSLTPLTPVGGGGGGEDQVIKCEDKAVATNNLVKLTARSGGGYHSVSVRAREAKGRGVKRRKKWGRWKYIFHRICIAACIS